jgi:phosphate/sulfate permease
MNASSNIQDHFFCVGTLLAAYCADYFVISHVAVSSAFGFSETHFGKGSNRKSFRNKGVGWVLVAVAQAVYTTLFPTRNLSIYCWSFWRDKQCFL